MLDLQYFWIQSQIFGHAKKRGFNKMIKKKNYTEGGQINLKLWNFAWWSIDPNNCFVYTHIFLKLKQMGLGGGLNIRYKK